LLAARQKNPGLRRANDTLFNVSERWAGRGARSTRDRTALLRRKAPGGATPAGAY